MGIASRNQLYSLATVVLPLLVGCGGNRADSPNLRYATEVFKSADETIRRDRLKGADRTMNAYRECGLRLKAINDSGVDEELADATQEWANACIRLSNSIHSLSQTPGADFAFVEGVFGLCAGENPGSVANRSLHRIKSQGDAAAAVERALFQEQAAKADMQRELAANLSGGEKAIVVARLESFRKQAKSNDYSSAASGDESVTPTKNNKSSSEADSKKKRNPIAIIFSFVYDWFGIPGVVILAIIGAAFLFGEKDSKSVSSMPSNSQTPGESEEL